MCTAGIFPEVAALVDVRSAALLRPGEQSPPIAPFTSRDTLQCRPEIAGSAAQFNQSVSTLPRYACSLTDAPGAGAVDTLSKCQTVLIYER